MAIGFHGDPVPPGSRSGRPTTMKSNRPSYREIRAKPLHVGAAEAFG